MRRNDSLIDKVKTSPDISIKEALKKIDTAAHRILFICDEHDALIGSLSDGDIRRRILKNGDLQEQIASCFNPNPTFALEESLSIDEMKKIMIEKGLNAIPVVDSQKRIVDIVFWDDIFEKDKELSKKIDIPVVVMAGGKGERLDPFTKILPKPLIPIGEKPIIEIIIDKFRQQGVRQFYVILNYKGEMVKTYFESIEKDYRLDYIWEKDFLGTAGGLKLLPAKIADTIIVSNCDIIVNVDYEDLVRFHWKNKHDLTVVGSIQHYRIPYGIVHFEKEGKIRRIHEKPEIDFMINTGVYVISKERINDIPENKCLDMTEFIQNLLDRNLNVGVYPISQKSYIDIGELEIYKKYTEKLL